jgi:hypothetical protein
MPRHRNANVTPGVLQATKNFNRFVDSDTSTYTKRNPPMILRSIEIFIQHKKTNFSDLSRIGI